VGSVYVDVGRSHDTNQGTHRATLTGTSSPTSFVASPRDTVDHGDVVRGVAGDVRL
jgi:hypothetical protein